ncbi:unnamed protein product [Linum tenue]|uniref:Uncharacterized protein n=1 Tax=Linum tenue TaxID=586396 RepID=A0AAV0RIJ9_9ROSI|nr:unnamed protein product [Linum tenue]CAI0557416.1 unnamed protein product [Linum tenue]
MAGIQGARFRDLHLFREFGRFRRFPAERDRSSAGELGRELHLGREERSKNRV